MTTLEMQIRELEKTLLSNEAYINYLGKEILNRDEGLEILRKNNMDLQKRLKKVLMDIEHKEETLIAMAQASNTNEVQSLVDAIRNAFNNIDSTLRRTPAIPRPLIDREINDIKNAMIRLRTIADQEKNRADQTQAQVDQNNQTIKRLNATARIADEELSLMTRVYHNERQARVPDAIAVPILFQQLPPDLIISTPPTIPPKDMEEINSSLLLKELYDMGFRDEPIVDFMESYNKRGEDYKRKQAQKDISDEARFLNPIAERKFKLANCIRQSAFAEEKRLQDPENIDEYINDELSALYGRNMSLGGVRRNPSKRCSPKKPVKKPGKVYSEDSNTESEEEDETNYGLIGGVKKKKKKSKARNIKKRPKITIVTREIFNTALKMMVEYFTKSYNQDVLRDGLNLLNLKYLGMKEILISQYANGFSSKEQEKIWNNVTKDFNEILQPCIDTTFSSNQPSIVRQATADMQIPPPETLMQQMQPLPTETYNPEWINPMQIGLIKRLPPNDVSTIPCEIVLPNGELFYNPEAWSDTYKIGTITRTLGTIYGLGIKVGGKNGCIIEGDFDEIDEKGLLLILGVPWLDKACALPDISSRKCIIRYSEFPYPSKLKAHLSRKTSCTTGNALSSNGNFSEDLSNTGNALSSARNFSEVLSSARNYEKMVPIRLTMA
nr:10138_t:CDS:2 [Entrophospora candida]